MKVERSVTFKWSFNLIKPNLQVYKLKNNLGQSQPIIFIVNVYTSTSTRFFLRTTLPTHSFQTKDLNNLFFAHFSHPLSPIFGTPLQVTKNLRICGEMSQHISLLRTPAARSPSQGTSDTTISRMVPAPAETFGESLPIYCNSQRRIQSYRRIQNFMLEWSTRTMFLNIQC